MNQGLKSFVKDFKVFLYKNKDMMFSVGGNYYTESGELDVVVSFFKSKFNFDSISESFNTANRVYGINPDKLENMIFFLDDSFDDEVVIQGNKIRNKLISYFKSLEEKTNERTSIL